MGRFRYHRQYVGFVREGVRLIYVNAYPAAGATEDDARPVITCDGGPVFWGVIYDPATGRFEDPAFNGSS